MKSLKSNSWKRSTWHWGLMRHLTSQSKRAKCLFFSARWTQKRSKMSFLKLASQRGVCQLLGYCVATLMQHIVFDHSSRLFLVVTSSPEPRPQWQCSMQIMLMFTDFTSTREFSSWSWSCGPSSWALVVTLLCSVTCLKGPFLASFYSHLAEAKNSP